MSTSGSKCSTILIPGNSGASPKRSCGAADEAAGHRAADVVVVHHDPRPRDELAPPRRSASRGSRRWRAAPPPRIVGEEHVARPNLLRGPVGEDLAHELVDRRTVLEDVDAAVQPAPVGRHQRGVEVVALVDDERARQPRRHPGLVVVDRPQPVADHLEGDRIQTMHGARTGRLARRGHRTTSRRSVGVASGSAPSASSETSSRIGSSRCATSAASEVAHPGQ